MFLGGDPTCQGLRNTAHAFPLALLTDPEWPVHDIVLHDGEPRQTIGFLRLHVDPRRLTQDFRTTEAGQPVTRLVAANEVEAENVAVLPAGGAEGRRAEPGGRLEIGGKAPGGGHQQQGQ